MGVATQRPGEPGDLVSFAYGDDVIESLWSHPSAVDVNGYEICRYGAFYSFTRGVSFVDQSVDAGNCYHYNIIAISDVGDIRGVSSIARVTGGASGC